MQSSQHLPVADCATTANRSETDRNPAFESRQQSHTALFLYSQVYSLFDQELLHQEGQLVEIWAGLLHNMALLLSEQWESSHAKSMRFQLAVVLNDPYLSSFIDASGYSFFTLHLYLAELNSDRLAPAA